MDLAPTARFVRGNADRSLIEASASEEPLDANDTWALASVWCARRLRNHHLDFLAGFEPVVELDVPPTGLLFCHGSPDSDEDIITEATPEEEVMDGFQAVTVGTVVCGHTHMQFDRMVNSIRLVNAGSVGMPYEAAPGAYWALIGEEIELRRTAYDLDAAASAIRLRIGPLRKSSRSRMF
jgi:predicted phosphodiesterase